MRLTSQITDGMFQAALFTAILFNPDRHAEPLAVAGGMAVLLLPYSVIGPFAGALLDHWDRRNVLMFANIARAVLIAGVAVAIAAGASETVILIGALLVTGASRFVSAGLSAGLPHVAHRDVIVATNALFTTLGAGMLAVGAGLTAALRLIFGDDNSGSALTTLGGVLMALVAAALAHRFARLQLGPDSPDDPGRSALHAVSVGLLHGVRAVAATPSVSAALSAIGAHRLVFGMNTLLILVLGIEVDTGMGLGLVALIGAATAVGAFLAAVVTPIAVAQVGRRVTLLAALTVGAVAELTLLGFHIVVFCVAALILGLVGQTAKLCGDAAMQVDIDDDVRGQVFSVQDAVFNVAYVVAITVAALIIPGDGHSLALPIIGTVIYLLGIFAVLALQRPTFATQHAHTSVTDDRTAVSPTES